MESKLRYIILDIIVHGLTKTIKSKFNVIYFCIHYIIKL